MKTQEHTAGPWQVLEVMGKKFVAGMPTGDHPYWQITRYVDVAGDEDYPRKDADLALIAAAPQLLEALQKIADNYGGCHCDHSDESCCEHPAVGEFCPHCIAEIAIRSAMKGKKK